MSLDSQARRPQRPTALVAALTVLALLLPACGPEEGEAPAKSPGFEEVGEAAGIDFFMTFLSGEQGENFKFNLYDHGSGVCVADYDGDGLEDLYFLNQLGANGLYRNNGDGTFADVTKAAGVGLGDRISTSASFADIDNDGDQDLFVASTRGGNVLFRNDGGGRFEDVTSA
ncbi:MAG: FG-GAP repeat domain-containing protein, partial [Planctomycetota bacterium]